MAVDVPIGAGVAQEPALLLETHGLPESLRVRAQHIDRRAPISAVHLEATRQRTQPMQQPREVLPERNLRRRESARNRHRAMGVRQQAAARDGDNRTAMSPPFQRQRHIDHRQTGADDQYRRLDGEAVERTRRPRLLGRDAADRRLDLVAGRQHDPVDAQRRARGEAQRHGGGAFAHRDDGISDVADVARGDGLAADIGDIIAIGPARNETERRRALAASTQPTDEMLRIVREGAHVGDPHVEQMPRIGGRIGEPGTDRLRRIDHQDVDALSPQAPSDLCGDENAGRSTADHCNPHHGRIIPNPRQPNLGASEYNYVLYIDPINISCKSPRRARLR